MIIGYKLSKETKNKMSLSKMGNKHCLGYKHTEETNQKISNKLKGRKLSEETKNKMSLSKMGNKHWLGKHHTEESKRKMSLANIGKNNYSYGKHPTKETKRKLSIARKGNKNALGYKHTEEAKRKMSESHRGEKSNLWKGGISFEPYGMAWTEQLKKGIRERDNNVCQLCGKHQSQLKRKLDVHHIDYVKTNIFTFNLISLCINCHRLTNGNRNHWTTFFRNYLSEKYGYTYHIEQKLLNEVYN